MNRCYVCNAEDRDACQAIDGEIAECPRPSRYDTKNFPVRDEIPGWENTSQETKQALTGRSRFLGMSDDEEPMARYFIPGGL